MSIFKQIKEAGLSYDCHESDLYVEVTPESQKIIDNYIFKSNVTKFRSQVDQKLYFDIPFAFDPFWEKRLNIK